MGRSQNNFRTVTRHKDLSNKFWLARVLFSDRSKNGKKRWTNPWVIFYKWTGLYFTRRVKTRTYRWGFSCLFKNTCNNRCDQSTWLANGAFGLLLVRTLFWLDIVHWLAVILSPDGAIIIQKNESKLLNIIKNTMDNNSGLSTCMSALFPSL